MEARTAGLGSDEEPLRHAQPVGHFRTDDFTLTSLVT